MNEALARDVASRGLDWIVPQWQGPARAMALFTTRHGGTSAGAAATMDLGPASLTAEDEAGAIGSNRRRLRALLPSDPVWLSQVHGRDVVTVDVSNVPVLRATPPRADAAVTRVTGVPIAVRAADCLPILLADREGSVLAVAHAGWRGLAAGVLEVTLDAMGVSPRTVIGWIGPAIGPLAFEVGRDVYDAFCLPDSGADAHFAPKGRGKWRADLAALARRRLAARGVSEVAGGEWCTQTETTRFFSWRRDKSCGRMALVAWLAPRPL